MPEMAESHRIIIRHINTNKYVPKTYSFYYRYSVVNDLLLGQYQIYPNYDEIAKYTGVLKPWNFEVFRKRLEENNISDQALDFFKASGASSGLCYKADIEMAIRTPGFGGFHLLGLFRNKASARKITGVGNISY